MYWDCSNLTVLNVLTPVVASVCRLVHIWPLFSWTGIGRLRELFHLTMTSSNLQCKKWDIKILSVRKSYMVELKKNRFETSIVPEYHQYCILTVCLLYSFWKSYNSFKGKAERFYWEQGLKKSLGQVASSPSWATHSLPFKLLISKHYSWQTTCLILHMISKWVMKSYLPREKNLLVPDHCTTFLELWRGFRNRPSMLVNSHVSKKGKK